MKIPYLLIVFALFVIGLIVLISYRYSQLESVYEYLPKEEVKVWTPPEYEVPNPEAKG